MVVEVAYNAAHAYSCAGIPNLMTTPLVAALTMIRSVTLRIQFHILPWVSSYDDVSGKASSVLPGVGWVAQWFLEEALMANA